MNEKKHENEMILNIDNNKNVFLSVDQTPTPTRLIKNCEEVGLFDDLKNVNPFDLTFRRAIEESKTSLKSTLNENPESLLINEDTLHTPQVLYTKPEELDLNVSKQQNQQENLENWEKNSNNETRRQKSIELVKQKSLIEKISKNSTVIKHRKILPKFDIEQVETNLNSTSLNFIQVPQIITQFTRINLPSTSPTKTNVEEKSNIKEIVSLPQKPARQLSIKEKLKSLINQKEPIPEVPTITIKKSITKHRKISRSNDADAKERRRAASSRYRHKMKREFSDLEKKNSKLLAENFELKEKIKQLNSFMMMHQNCDVSKKILEKSPNGKTAKLLIKQLPQIQIQPPTIIMNIPKFVIQPTIAFNQHLDKNSCDELR